MWEDRRSYADGYQSKPFNSSSGDSQAQRDRARLIHSSAFRRLQSKTQVLGLGESDFYRTRLTHSLEVAQIGSGICEKLREKYGSVHEVFDWIPSLSQIEAICLSHDIGHPPFGHGGEVALNFYMRWNGGFEGNGQTLRIVSKLGEYSPDRGLDLTRRTMLGIIKYPVLYKELAVSGVDKACDDKINIDSYKPPKCIHDDEEEVLDWVLSAMPVRDVQEFRKVKVKDGKPKSKYKAFDTSIMELADDIAYGVHDFEDALALRLVTEKEWSQDVLDKLDENSVISKDVTFYTEKLFSYSNKDRKHAVSKLVGYFVSEIEVRAQGVFETPLLDLQACMSDEAVHTLEVLKSFVINHVIKRPEVQTLEYKGQQIVLRLFEVLQQNPNRLLPSSTFGKYKLSGNPNRVICDYVSGMTDSYAKKLYHKLFSPDVGSIFDRL
ncbi:anti-phage deoxyguanosine triphosphatase [Halomonas sp. MCCC 1A11062]|uniref:anti-phage deoxyguanosine triphosphatase n=1 Tax=Halomonas sp. MCCC 1A11062 TaxID=2733485 RepID=UPI001F2C5833|nr:anti-phage deoxyguanosine triphosphatase [Halomonas sp. MCCC 1A11062]MCE8040138.1 deoxyguanosinetriphosphate triphosphohydrolase family protein [Halomonas sp. MCCC 1A11062]